MHLLCPLTRLLLETGFCVDTPMPVWSGDQSLHRDVGAALLSLAQAQSLCSLSMILYCFISTVRVCWAKTRCPLLCYVKVTLVTAIPSRHKVGQPTCTRSLSQPASVGLSQHTRPATLCGRRHVSASIVFVASCAMLPAFVARSRQSLVQLPALFQALLHCPVKHVVVCKAVALV